METTYPAMTFGLAIEAMKRGEWVRRAGWSGKDVRVSLSTPDGTRPYFCLLDIEGEYHLYWLPSAPDCLADDWRIAE